MVNQNSKTQYESTYKMLVKNAGSDKPSDLYEYILKKKIKDNTKANYLNSIISLKKIDKDLVKGDLSEISEYRDKLNLKIEKDRETDNITSGQKKAMENVDLNKLNDLVTELDKKKNTSLKTLEDYILLYLMIKYPIRNDLQEIEIVKAKKDIKSNKNILFLGKTTSTIYLREYKTSKSFGEIKIDLNEDITKDIHNLVNRDINRKFLFVGKENKPLSTSSLTHRLNSITKKYLGYPLGSTLIRKIYLSGKYAPVIEQMKDDAKVMGHSTNTAQAVYIKNSK